MTGSRGIDLRAMGLLLTLIGQDIEYHGSQEHNALDDALIVLIQTDQAHAQVDAGR